MVRYRVAVVGGGPAGLAAAERLSAAGAAVVVYERMPSLGRKLLMAGRGGLNLTHSEPLEQFVARYGASAERLAGVIRRFGPADLTAWAEGLGQPTFVGSSGRVFPKAFKASPLLRAWLARLAAQNVEFRLRRTWRGWRGCELVFEDEQGRSEGATVDAAVLALGGASWPRLGSDGGWAQVLAAQGVAVAPFRPANCGFEVAWSEAFRRRFAGAPIKNVRLSGAGGQARGEAVVTAYGLEGGAIYALSARLRDAIEADGAAPLKIDLRPQLTLEALSARLARPRGGASLSNFLRKAAGLSALEVNLLREAFGGRPPEEPARLAQAIKAAPIVLTAPRPLERAISTAGGVRWSELDERLMLKARPGVFVAGEMIDWEAPTGGYLLQASFATGLVAADGVLDFLRKDDQP